MKHDALATSWFPMRSVRVDAEQRPRRSRASAPEAPRNLPAIRSATARTGAAAVPTELVRLTRVHFHVDAKDLAAVRAIARDIHVRDTARVS
jgi:hypothetical protein